jgi:hypothetical protein
MVSLPFVLVFIIYFIIHSKIVHVQPAGGEDNYNFRFGMNILKNLGMMLFSVYLPLSSVRTFDAVILRDYKFLAAAFSLTALFTGTVFWGIWKSKRVREAAVWFCFIIAGFLLYLLMNHVNEHYTYISMPFIAIVTGIGLGYFVNNLKRKSRVFFITVLALFFLLNCYAVMEKSGQIDETGERADMLFEQINKYTPQLRHNGVLVLVNPPDMQLKYSVFRLPGFESIRYTQFYIYKLAGRSDFRVEVINWNEVEKWKKPDALVLKLEGDKVLRME